MMGIGRFLSDFADQDAPGPVAVKLCRNHVQRRAMLRSAGTKPWRPAGRIFSARTGGNVGFTRCGSVARLLEKARILPGKIQVMIPR
jgi:hypothetical protein